MSEPVEKEHLENFTGETVGELIALEATYKESSLLFCLEKNLVKKEHHNDEENLIMAICAFDRAVNNGGVYSLFYNSVGNFAERLVQDLNTIGLPEASKKLGLIFEKVGLSVRATREELEEVSGTDQWEEYEEENEVPASDYLWPWLKQNHSMVKMC